MPVLDHLKRDVERLKLNELKALDEFIRDKLRVKRRAEAMNAIMSIAKDAGIDLQELVEFGEVNNTCASDPTDTANKVGSKVYVHPDNSSLVWNGRGRHPLWFKDLIRKGIPPDRLLKRS
ncbi:MAG: H-NS histone family protein [Gammaproteobacteria bacterium]|nr:H-NS histone family protein [Gammaproteobacteria bacterium]